MGELGGKAGEEVVREGIEARIGVELGAGEALGPGKRPALGVKNLATLWRNVTSPKPLTSPSINEQRPFLVVTREAEVGWLSSPWLPTRSRPRGGGGGVRNVDEQDPQFEDITEEADAEALPEEGQWNGSRED